MSRVLAVLALIATPRMSLRIWCYLTKETGLWRNDNSGRHRTLSPRIPAPHWPGYTLHHHATVHNMKHEWLDARQKERELCKQDVCMYCGGRALGYKRIPDGPNEAGNWTHLYTTTMRSNDRVLCIASSIFARESFDRTRKP